MANVQTINLLIARIRQRSDQINGNTFDDASELKPWLRGSLSQLYAKLCLRAAEYYTTCRPISLHAGQEAYSLPSDFMALQELFVLYNGGKSRRKIMPMDTDAFGESFGYPNLGNAQMQYAVMRNLLYISPVPTVDAYNALEIHYTPQYRAPLLDYSSIDDVMPNGWEEWAVLDVMQKMSIKARLLNMDDILKSKAALENDLLKNSSRRVAYAPQMRDSATSSYRSVYAGGPPNGPLYWSIP